MNDLIQAVESHDRASVRAAIVNGTDVNVRDSLGRTGLAGAAESGDLEIVRLLLQSGADPNIADVAGGTPLMLAARNQHEAVIAALLEAGSNPLVSDIGGSTARWHSMRRVVELTCPFLPRRHATLFLPRLFRSRSTRLIDAAIAARPKTGSR